MKDVFGNSIWKVFSEMHLRKLKNNWFRRCISENTNFWCILGYISKIWKNNKKIKKLQNRILNMICPPSMDKEIFNNKFTTEEKREIIFVCSKPSSFVILAIKRGLITPPFSISHYTLWSPQRDSLVFTFLSSLFLFHLPALYPNMGAEPRHSRSFVSKIYAPIANEFPFATPLPSLRTNELELVFFFSLYPQFPNFYYLLFWHF